MTIYNVWLAAEQQDNTASAVLIMNVQTLLSHKHSLEYQQVQYLLHSSECLCDSSDVHTNRQGQIRPVFIGSS